MSLQPAIIAGKQHIGKDLRVGKDVVIEAEEVTIGEGVSLGAEDDEEAFRNVGGIRIKCRSIHIGNNSRIAREVLIKGGDIRIGESVSIREQSTIHVTKKFNLEDHSNINPYCRIAGRDIDIGSNFRMLTWASIGGGSCFEAQSKLRIGTDGHLGEFSMINTAEEVHIGDEVGIGMRSAIFTHGAYQSFLDGYPVTFGPVKIGDKCWLPQAVVLPNVTIGKGTVVATGSLVNKDLPEYSLAGGVPAKVIRPGAFSTPPERALQDELMKSFLDRMAKILLDVFGEDNTGRKCDGWVFRGGKALWYFDELAESSFEEENFNKGDTVIALTADKNAMKLMENDAFFIILDTRTLVGNADELSHRVLNQFRRYGVRFG
ncbi:MAG: hypothetical protein EAX95_13600 [Candidatus Thorarchaeota archaeon]|nr:hypothetical protein [Candidatus Thorarchaeota archaeon]